MRKITPVSEAVGFDELKAVFKKLHSSKGCAWDRSQTQQSLISLLKEEVQEYSASVNAGDLDGIKEELGDILLHVMFSAQIAEKKKQFTIDDVIDGLIQKLKRRHPHVFAKKKISSIRQIIAHWKKIKIQEKRRKLKERGIK